MNRFGNREQRTLASLILLFLCLWALGTAGWRQADPELDWLEAIYRGLQMFSLNFTEPPGNIVPWELQVARFAEPAFTIIAFAATVSTQLRLIFRTLITHRAEQVTIIGYGVSGKAAAEQFRGTLPAARLVALDYSVNSADYRAARRHGVELIDCDALDAEARRSYAIGIPRSRELVIACGTDQTNLSLLDELSSELSGASPPVRLWLHLSSHALAERLRESYSCPRPGAPTIEFVEAADHAAQSVVLIHPLVLEARAAGLKRVHAVIHGFDDFGWLAAEQVLLNGIFPAPGFATPRVSVIAEDAAVAEAQWHARHPGMKGMLDVCFHAPEGGAIAWANVDDPMLTLVEDLPPSIHIFAGPESASELALVAALALRDGMRRGSRPAAPIVVRSDQRLLTGRDLGTPSGVAQLRLTIVDGYDTPVSAFGVIGRVLEERARAFHASYAGTSDPLDFNRLPHTQRLSNRRAAYHMLEKLRLLGFEDAAPTGSGYGLSDQGFAWLQRLDEERLREFDLLEHLRWRADRYIEGWRAGPRNSERRLRDRLGDDWSHYQALSADERSKDRSQFETFVASATAAPSGQGVARIVDLRWEGALPTWIMGDRPTLAIDDAAVTRYLAVASDCVPRLCLLVPRLPPSGLSADVEATVLRDALVRFGERLLDLGPSGMRVRFLRPASHPWDWLPPDERGLVDGVTLTDFAVGFASHRDPRRLGDLGTLGATLRTELMALVTPGTRLFTGLADDADRLMVQLWSELGLGPITGLVPYWREGPAIGPGVDDAIPHDLQLLCDAVELPPDLPPEEDEIGRQAAVADAVLQRATMLFAVSDGGNGGPGGVEDSVGKARTLRMPLRYIGVGT